MMPRERRRDIVIGLLLTMGLLLVGEMAARAYVRFIRSRTLLDEWEVADPVLGWNARPGLKKGGTEINSLRFRSREFPVRKAPGTLRIVAMKGSTTFGYSETRESSYPVQLERALNQQPGSCGLRYDVPLPELAVGIRQIQNGRTLFIDMPHFNTPCYRALAQIMARGLAAGRLLPSAPVTRARETS